MKRIIEYAIGCLFIFSTVAKLVDFQNTVNFITAFSGMEFYAAKLSLLFLCSAEATIGFSFITRLWKTQRVFLGTLTFMIFFIVVNIAMLIGGYSNCGCFGTQIESDPIFSLIKNLLILAFMLHEKLKQKTIQPV